MERTPENTPENNFKKLVEAACDWGERHAAEILIAGEALHDEEIALAQEVGVQAPEQVRILEVDCIPPLEDKNLSALADAAGLRFDISQGMTLGYGIYIVTGARSRQLM